MVDSIFFKDGLKHIGGHWLTYPYYDFTFIESVGPGKWFIYVHFPQNGYLNCFQNQSIFYKNDDYYPCGFQGGCGVTDILEDNYNIFVQKNKIEIVFDYNMNVEISIYDIKGILLYESGFNTQNIVIPTTQFLKGVYVLKMLDKNTNKQYSTKIFVL